MSVGREITAIAQAAADAAAVNALNTIAEFVRERGFAELADDILATFGAPSEGDSLDDGQGDLLAEPPPAEPAPAEPILIAGELD
jgi:hypothetical protein